MNKKPLQKSFTIALFNGGTIVTQWASPKEKLRTDVDSTVHPIWNSSKGVILTEHQGRMSTFQKRFGSLSLSNEK